MSSCYFTFFPSPLYAYQALFIFLCMFLFLTIIIGQYSGSYFTLQPAKFKILSELKSLPLFMNPEI